MTSKISAGAVVRCLGGFSLEMRGRPVKRWRAGKARDLFLYLLVNRGRPVDRDELYAALWPDRVRSPRSSSVKVAKHAVHQILSGHGSSTGEQPAAEIVLNECGYTLKVYDVWLDFEEFERLCHNGHRAAARGDRPTALDQYHRALELHVGEFLHGETADWIREQQDWARSLALGAADYLLQDALCREDTPAVIALCRRSLDIDPYQEDVYRTLIQVHGELGQLGQAKAWYELCNRRLSGDLDIDVSQSTRRVFDRMMRVRGLSAASRARRVTTP
ncbi:AfsR/SARP family transcriptional regulator [Streptomyces sp. NPDC054841]